jgi:hypothetical protein
VRTIFRLGALVAAIILCALSATVFAGPVTISARGNDSLDTGNPLHTATVQIL